VQRLDRRNISIPYPHADGWEIDEESIDAALEVALNLAF
jgi:hypothetical protein